MQAIKKHDFLLQIHQKNTTGSVVLFCESQFVTYWGEIWASQIAWKIEKGAIWRRQNDEKPFLIFAFLHVSPTQPKSLYLSHVVVFLSSPIACVACERLELLKTAIDEAKMEVIYKLRRTRCYFGELCSIWIIFGTYGMDTFGMYT